MSTGAAIAAQAKTAFNASAVSALRASVERRRAMVLEQQQTRAGVRPRWDMLIDDAPALDFTRLKATSRVTVRFYYLEEAVRVGQALLERLSPVLTGAYRQAHKVFLNGSEIAADAPIPNGAQVVLANLEPYARKIEQGLSPKAPNGVFEVTEAALNRIYGRVLKINFTYTGFAGASVLAGPKGNKSAVRYPSIEIRDVRVR